MSCLDVMYHQSYGAHYLPADAYRATCYGHQQQQQQQRKLNLHTKMHHCSTQQQQQQAGGRAAPCRGPDPSGCSSLSEAELKDGGLPAGAEYLNSRCVLFTYFQGDIGEVVDQHFSRALSQAAASFNRTPSGGRTPSFKGGRTSQPPASNSSGLWKEGAPSPEGPSAASWSGPYPSPPASCLPSVSVSLHPDLAPLHPGEGALWAGHVLTPASLSPLAALPDSWSYGLNSPAAAAAGYAGVHEVYHPHGHGHAHLHPRHHAVFHPYASHSPALESRFAPLLLPGARNQQPSGSPHSEKAELEPCGGGGGGSPVAAPPGSWTPSPLHGPLEAYDSVVDQNKAKSSVWF